MPATLIVLLSGPVALQELVRDAESILPRILGMQKHSKINLTENGDGKSYPLSTDVLQGERDLCVRVRLASTDAVSHAFAFESSIAGKRQHCGEPALPRQGFGDTARIR
jgi:hypothetical protein